MRRSRTAFLAAALAFAGAAQADEPAAPPQAGFWSGWRLEATAAGWATAHDGLVGITKPPIFNVDARYGAVMPDPNVLPSVAFAARKDAYIVGADYGLTTMTQAFSTPLFSFLSQPQIVVTKARYQVGDVFAGYRLPFGPPALSLYATLGARFNVVSATVAVSDATIGYYKAKPLVAGWVDPTIGLLAEVRLDPKWSVKASGDMGGFDVGSNLTAAGSLAIAYDWTPAISTSFGYKALYTDCDILKSNGAAFRYYTTVHGPYAAVTYAF